MKAFYEFPTCVGKVGARRCACLENRQMVQQELMLRKTSPCREIRITPGEPGNCCAAACTSVSLLLQPPA